MEEGRKVHRRGDRRTGDVGAGPESVVKMNGEGKVNVGPSLLDNGTRGPSAGHRDAKR